MSAPAGPDETADRRRPPGGSRRLRGLFADDPDFQVVGEAANGTEAVARVEHVGADVVLMALRMPEMSGVEAISRLHRTRPPPEALSQRELEVLALIAEGATNRQAAAKLFISEATVKTHLLHVYEKLGVRDRAAAVAKAYRRRLLT
jgi:DNA-binding NarL/FixJ family response regulator